MCGIAGYIDLRRGTPDELLAATATAMSDAIRHRGPDMGDVWADGADGVALAFRRLAIIDLSPLGHQPMQSANERYVITYNGEVYNYPELRRDLEAEGAAFRGHSDTEVFLEGFARWGVRATLARMVGMFAIALWDRQEKQLTLIRDRLGIKPPEPDVAPTEPAAALEYWQEKLTANSADSAARLEVGRLQIALGDVDSGRGTLEAIEASHPEYNAAQAALATLDLATAVGEAGGEAAVRAQLAENPDDERARYLVACAEASLGRYVAALTVFVALVGSAGAEVKADAKKAASVVFEAAGRQDPEVEQLRRKLARLLF